MRHKVVVEPRAKTDIIVIKKWYRKQKSGLENEFVIELDENILLLSQNPLLFEVRYTNLRAVILKRFPYLIYYFIENKTIKIIAVLAAKQDQPTILKTR